MKKLFCFAFVILLTVPFFRVSAVSAKSAILVNGDTGEIIFEQNADERLSMASTTKIMTGLLLCEYGNFDKEITVTDEMVRVEGSSMGLVGGDRVTVHDLLYGLLLSSGNDAANVIAYTVGGTVDGFAKLMNQKAKQIGMTATHFVTPSGLDSAEHYTTARDMALLARYAMKNPDFAAAVSAKDATLCYGNPPYKRSLTNHNKLLKTYDGAVGVKTGYTKKSGRCLVSAARKDGKFVIAVTLNDPDDWADHKELLDYGFSALKTAQIMPENSSYSIEVISGSLKYTTVGVKPYSVNVLRDNDLLCEVNLPKFVYAPIKKGEKIGEAVYKNGDTVIEKVDLCADENIGTKEQKKGLLETYGYLISNIWVK